VLLNENTPLNVQVRFPPGANSVLDRSMADNPYCNALPQHVLNRYKAARGKVRDVLQKSRDLRAAYALLGVAPPTALGQQPGRISAARLSRLLRQAESDNTEARDKLSNLLQKTPAVWMGVLQDFVCIEQQLMSLASNDDETHQCRLARRFHDMQARFDLPNVDPLMRLMIASLLLCWLHFQCIDVLGRGYDRHSPEAKKWARWFAQAWREVHETAWAYRELGEAVFAAAAK